jgi:hypothetical protein
MLESAVAAGVAAAGGQALLGGVLPTPGVPLLIARHGFDLGVVISASHNPYRDNGIKFFGGDGFKLSDATEQAIEARLEAEPAVPPRLGRVRAFHGALEDYLRALQERFAGLDLSGRRIAIDCANGATFRPRPRSSAGWAPTSTSSRTARTAATSTRAAARRTSARSRSTSAPTGTTRGSPSTGTATASSPSTGPAPWSTATS